MGFTSKTVVINLEHRTDRRSEIEGELSRVGWAAEFFPAIRPGDAGGFPSVGARGCFLSHLAVLRMARDAGVDHLILLEDDVTFVRDFSNQWRGVLRKLDTEKWMIFYPGHVLEGLPIGLSLLSPLAGVRCTHFLMLNSNAIPKVIDGLETILSRPPGHPLGGPMHVDGAYSTIRSQSPEITTYAYSPALGYQRPSRTDVGDVRWFDRVEVIRPVLELARKAKTRLLRAKR